MSKTYKQRRREIMKRYLRSHPWTKHYNWSLTRAKHKGFQHTMNVADFKELWFRDEAFKLERPSTDRIDPTKGYVKENCRFIELVENVMLGQTFAPCVAYVGEEMRMFPSIQQAARDIGGNASHICACMRGRRQTHMGYYWRYI